MYTLLRTVVYRIVQLHSVLSNAIYMELQLQLQPHNPSPIKPHLN
jgi:hypothetical protein